ncbi:MAG TPA: YhdP family protein [Burkholderiaceae bacterium]|nr:YhdP family protein [Burkholderiaceae bacterium]
MSPASPVIASRGSFWRWSTRALRLLVGVLLLSWSLLLVAWLTLHWGILPRIDEWRPRIEALASRALGAPVRIGEIQVRSRGWIPAAELRDVVLLDRSGREALRLPGVHAALSVPSLMAFRLRFEQLLIDGAELVVRRDANGRISVGGLDLGGEMRSDDDGGNPAADWFFQQREFVIRGATVTWIDEQRGAAPLQLTDASMVVRNGLRQHDLRIDATPQATWGDRFTLRARMNQSLVARAGDWRHWRGTVFAELPHVDVAQLRSYVDLPFELREGRGAMRAWVDMAEGQPGAATVDLALRDVGLRLSKQVQPLQFEHLSGRLDGEQGPQHARVSARRLNFATTDGVMWADSNVDASWRFAARPTGETELTAGEVSADRLDLATIALIAARVPLGDAVRKGLAELAPRGTVHDLVARWDGPLDEPRHYQARARIKGLSIAAGSAAQGVGRPGWRNADIDLQASDTGGDARLSMADGVMEFPGVFDKAAVPLRRFDAQLAWRLGEPRPQGRSVELRVKDARFENDDTKGELNAGWRTGEGGGVARGGRFPGTLDLRGKLADARATSVARYLPLGLPASARDYVERAVQGGTVTSASFEVKGDLWDFPFHGAKATRDSVFRIAGQARDVTFAYVPHLAARDNQAAYESPWPVITRAEGELVFDRSSMTIRHAQGRIFNTELRGVAVQVKDFAHEPVVEIDGQARGALGDMLRYVSTTPVGELIGGALTQTQVTGNADLRLALQLPLGHSDHTTLKGSVQLSGNDVRLRPDVPLLANARGRVDFTQKGVQVVGANARALGGDLAFDGGTSPDGALRFTGQGTVTADGLRRATELGAAAKLAASVQGQAAYRLQLGFNKGQPEFLLTSNLAGLALNLPAPLNKPAEATWPLRVQSTPQADAIGNNAMPRDQLRIELGSVVQANYLRELGAAGPRVLRGAIGINTPAPPPVPGAQALAEFTQPVSLDAWRAVLAAAATGAGASGPDSGYLPRQITLRARELTVSGRRFTAAQVELQRSDDAWRAKLQSDQIVGTAEYREPRSAAAAGQVQARLSRLHLAAEPAPTVPRPEPTIDVAPSSVPAMDVVVEDLEWRGRKLGRVEIEAVNRTAPGTSQREWRLQRLLMRMPEATLTANGQWAAVPGASGAASRRMLLNLQLDLAESGAFVERLGFGKTLRGGKGRLSGELAWSGSPLSLDVPSLDGQITLALEAGQFLKADAGAARLLGVLSLQALPRRLLLDFRDVFQEGFAFDKIEGDIKLAAGVAGISSLRMHGVNATVLMDGKADIARETQDLRVFVVPEINAGTASLAYAAINPAIGLGTFLAQWLLRRPLIAANTREFHVTGSWDDPKIDRIERKPAEAASTTGTQ